VKSISKHPTKSNAFEHSIFIFGPTGVGKTELLLDLDPQRFSVINADSIQVYRYLDVGSAKPSAAVRLAIEHHLIDIRDPWEQFSVGNFIEEADKACLLIHEQGKIPVISGGTAYYFKHFLYGLSEAPPSDEAIRESIAGVLKPKAGSGPSIFATSRSGERRTHPPQRHVPRQPGPGGLGDLQQALEQLFTSIRAEKRHASLGHRTAAPK
jgi:hypothetical protein